MKDFKHAEKKGHELRAKLRDVLEKAGVWIDENGSFCDMENWAAIMAMRMTNIYYLTLDSIDVMIIHGLLRIKEMYPGDLQLKDPKSYEVVLVALRDWCALCFMQMGFTSEEVEYFESATVDAPGYIAGAEIASSEGDNYGH